MEIILYQANWSSPCRAVMITAKTLGLDITLKDLELMTGDHLKPEYLEINPQHTIPTLIDGEFKLWERYVVNFLT